MTVLSNIDIVEFERSGNLRIVDGDESCHRSSSYVLRLHNFMLARKSEPTIIDTKKTDTSELYDKVEIPETGLILEPGKIYLGASLEKISLGRSVCAELGLLSCYARIGLNLNFGSNFVAATFGEDNPSRIIFEILNLSQDKIRIYPGVKFCHLRFYLQHSPSSFPYDGIYATGDEMSASNFKSKPAR